MRTCVLILSDETTFMLSSEYITTASVFSSCSGICALTMACIHCGASPPAMAGSATIRIEPARVSTRRVFTSVARCGCVRLQDHLLFVGSPYDLKNLPKGAVVLLRKQGDIDIQRPAQVERALIVGRLKVVGDCFSVEWFDLRKAGNLPSEGQIDADIVRSLEGEIEVDRVHTLRMIEQMLLGRAEETDRKQRTPAGG